MKKIAFFDTKKYDKDSFESVEHEGIKFKYFENQSN